jgi:hypothetical protein
VSEERSPEAEAIDFRNEDHPRECSESVSETTRRRGRSSERGGVVSAALRLESELTRLLCWGNGVDFFFGHSELAGRVNVARGVR